MIRVVGRSTWLIALVVAALLIAAGEAFAQFPVPVPGQPTPTPRAADPRLAQMRAGVEKEGIKVIEVGFLPAGSNNPITWYVDSQAGYSQPSIPKLLTQGFKIWGVMYPLIAQEPAQAVMHLGQFWGKFDLQLRATIGDYTRLVTSYRAATTDAAKEKAIDNFLSAVRFRIYDTERREFVDVKDFTNKNFTGT